MAFNLINIDEWPRREYYLHYINNVTCTYSLNTDIDITNIRSEKLYPRMLWLLTDTVNDYAEFRTHLSPEGVGIFDSMTPSYTIFNIENENFSVIWTEFSPDYNTFLQRYLEDTETYRTSTRFSPKPDKPANCFDVSMIPWVGFTALNINVYDSGKYLLPIFTMGKTFERDGRLYMPLAVQVHHAVCDGFHAARFINAQQDKINKI